MNVRHPMVFYDKMDLRLFYFHVTIHSLWGKDINPLLSPVAMTRKYNNFSKNNNLILICYSYKSNQVNYNIIIIITNRVFQFKEIRNYECSTRLIQSLKAFLTY